MRNIQRLRTQYDDCTVGLSDKVILQAYEQVCEEFDDEVEAEENFIELMYKAQDALHANN